MRTALVLFVVSAAAQLGAANSNPLANAPIRFEPNRGQTDSSVLFFARESGFRIALRRTHADFVLADTEGNARAIRMRMTGAAKAAEVRGEERLGGHSNYIIGSDPKGWIKDVDHFGRVRYRGIYPGVDMVYYSRGSKLEYDFVVAPGGDARGIRLEYEGTQPVLEANGDLLLKLEGGAVLQRKPVAYQTIGGTRREVEVTYALEGNRIGFRLGRYDRTKELVIDPVIVYSSYLGGSAGDRGAGIAVDSQGNAYVTGTTSSADFPHPGAFQSVVKGGNDAFVTKVNAAGSAVVYSTFIGGTQTVAGFGHDHGRAIYVDGSGNAIVAGLTDSADFPIVAGAVQSTYGGGFGDGFVLKLNSSGNGLIFSTYIGGSDLDIAQSVAVDGSGGIYLCGVTMSANFPVLNAAQSTLKGPRDGFVTKLNATATARVYSTYLGGSLDDFAHDIAVDGGGNAYVAGETYSTDFPLSGPYQSAKSDGEDAFMAKLDVSGHLTLGTYLGGRGRDQGLSIALDSAGNIYVAGETSSGDFPTTGSAYQRALGGFSDAFVTKFMPSGVQLAYSTYLGGSLTDGAFAIAVDGAGQAHITGRTWSSNFPLQDAFQAQYGGDFSDGFVAKLNATGTGLIYSSYLGGRNQDNADNATEFLQVGGVAIDSGGNAYYTGRTDSDNFPTTSGAFQLSFGGRSFSVGDDNAFDAFVVKIAATGTTPGGGSSATAPTISLLNPSAVQAGSAGFALSVTGANFTPQSIVRWNGQNRSTVYSSAALLVATITSGDVSLPGSQLVTVYEPSSHASSPAAILLVNVDQSQVPGAPSGPNPADGADGVSRTPALSWTGNAQAAFYDVYFGTTAVPPLVTTTTATSYSPGFLDAGTTYYWRVAARNSAGNISSLTWRFTTTTGGSTPGYRFVPISPCRVVDTRAGQGLTGAFGPPSLAASAARDFPVPQGRCNVPATARAYSLNVTVVPLEPLAYLSIWPTGQPQPTVSTLNAPHGGVTANAAIVPAGTNGWITVLATNRTDLVIDINGYFEQNGTYSFYSVDPCRLADTRSGSGFDGTFGFPHLSGGGSREFSPLSSRCPLPAAAAYSLNVTAVPKEPLAYLTLWPSGGQRPLASTLNAMDGSVVANAAIVPSGVNGSVQTFATHNTDLVLDVNGYFASRGLPNEQLFNPITPCRVVDTRIAGSGAPVLAAGETRNFTIGGKCGVPPSAKAYALNVTVVPTSALSYLTIWPAGKARPYVSTLNSYLGRIVANAAMVPAGTGGIISVFATDQTHVVIDVNGYFQ